MNAATTCGIALVVAPGLSASERVVRSALPIARVEQVVTTRVPHLVVRVALADIGDWPPLRSAFGRLATGHDWLVMAVGPRGNGDDVERRRARAQALLPLATRLPTSRRLLDVDELLVYQVLVATDTAAQAAVVRDVLGPVLSQPNGTARRLLATLDALHWNDGSAKAAGRSLGIHVKTVHNRLRRVEQLTGLCLDHPPDRLRLDVALYLLRAHEAGLSACA
ncbi:MAG TPA: helix-turn-helix domain-containing protein [Acidimicrobiales bacterium]|nr:helix-turn-helix domain-containing protein [Acidimicrobiales bacterium]